MSYEYSEDKVVEDPAEEILLDLQWQVITAWTEPLSKLPNRSDGLLGRANRSEVILQRYLMNALQVLNPNLPQSAYQSAIEQIQQAEAGKKLADINKAKHALLTHGVEVSYQDADGVLQTQRLRVFDFNEPHNNHFLAVRQLTIKGAL